MLVFRKAGGGKRKAGKTAKPSDAGESASAKDAKPSLDDRNRPAAMEKPAQPDDLKMISGVGPKIEGILNDLGLNQCNADEQRLAQSQGLHECTYVGTYCDEKTFFGVCLKKKRSYCCHGSRLSRILTEQGRAQLGRAYGDVKSPDCSGFTVDEFASLDIGAMDLSEFYEDLEASLTLPDPVDASAAMQERLRNYGN